MKCTKFLTGLLLIALAMASIFPAYAATQPSKALVKYQDGTYALSIPTFSNRHDVAANTAESDTVPSISSVKAQYVNFIPTAACVDFYVNYTTTAVVPGGDITDGSAPDHNPTMRYIAGTVTTISLIAPNACTITLEYFMKP